MNTCKTCRHWSPWLANLPYNANIPSGLCKHPKVGVEDEPTPQDGLGIFCHESGAGLKTGPDFGCIHHALDVERYIHAQKIKEIGLAVDRAALGLPP